MTDERSYDLMSSDRSQLGNCRGRCAFVRDEPSTRGPEIVGNVELLSGQQLPVRVVWAQDGEADVHFLGPVASGLTVMRWLREAARRY
jgi:hypothetical protein